MTDRITVLRDGCKISDVDTSEIDGSELSRLMIGRDLVPLERENELRDRDNKSQGLVVRNLDYSERNLNKLRDVSFSLKSGEILGIAGVDGNGQKELAECILGIRKSHHGIIELHNMDIVTQSI